MHPEDDAGILVRGLSKTYRKKPVLIDVSLSVPTGSITGILGPNGSGKSTVMRSMVGLSAPDAGTTTFDGTSFQDLPHPGRTVGALLDPTAHHPGRSVRDTLANAAVLAGVAAQRPEELIDVLGLASVSRRRFGALSLGMKQRVALGVALIGSPRYLLLDEPLNGLDIETADWLRTTLLHHAHVTGGSVLVSTHLLEELQTWADRIVVLSEGEIRFSGAVSTLDSNAAAAVTVTEPERLQQALRSRGIRFSVEPDSRRLAVDLDPRALSRICIAENIEIDELTSSQGSISDTYRRLTRGEYRVEGDALGTH